MHVYIVFMSPQTH